MEFEFPAAANRFRAELREFLAQELPDWWSSLWDEDERIFPFTRQFCRKLADRGWLTAAWPAKYGGGDADVWTQMVIREEMWAAGEPRGPQYMNLNYIGPIIMEFGTPEQQERFLKPMAAGDVIWCQGFSEPGAGSDLASLTTRATDNGDCLVVNGQKSWTSYANEADRCLLFVRTNPDAPNHKALSMLLVDMSLPGITVRPIESMAGRAEFNEVFFDDVAVPYDCVLGPRDEGWSVAMSGLTQERVGNTFHTRLKMVLEELEAYARSTTDERGRPLSQQPVVRTSLVRLQAHYRASRLLGYRVLSTQEAGRDDIMGPAVFKVFATEACLLAGHLGLDITGSKGVLTQEDPLSPLGGDVYRHWVQSVPGLIYAGTNDIQRNIIAQRGLGLPRV